MTKFVGYTTEAQRPDPPEDAETFVVANKTLSLSPSKLRDLPEEELEEYGFQAPDEDELIKKGATLEEGEEIPPSIAREVYPAFHDQIGVLDENGRPVE